MKESFEQSCTYLEEKRSSANSYRDIESHNKKISCRFCQSRGNFETLSVKQTGYDKCDKFEYILCNDCKSLSIKSVPEDLPKYYEGYYSYQHFNSENLNFHEKIRLFFYRHHRFFYPFISQITSIYEYNLKSILPIKLSKDSKILDVGSGSGKFVFDLHNLGYGKAIGIDPYLEKDIKYPNGAQVFRKSLSDVNDEFDLITFHHTFEHMEDLEEVLHATQKVLVKGGKCIIRVPNIDSYAFYRFREHWTGIHAPFHLNLPSYSMMKQLVSRNNMCIYNVVGEQSYRFFLANVENQLNVVDDKNMFSKISSFSHSFLDKLYWKVKACNVRRFPKRCEWVAYYIEKISLF